MEESTPLTEIEEIRAAGQLLAFFAMPRVSNRQQCLKWVRQQLYCSILMESSSDTDSGSDGSSSSSGVFSPGSSSDVELDSSSDSDAGMHHDPGNVEPRPGLPGSCSDSMCLKRGELWQEIHRNDIFGPGQYILGDSGYVNAPHLVCSFRMTLNQKDYMDFNHCVAKTRYVNEHCIGILKNRWFWLKEIQTQLKGQSDNIKMVRYIHTCVLLHNYVISKNDV